MQWTWAYCGGLPHSLFCTVLSREWETTMSLTDCFFLPLVSQQYKRITLKCVIISAFHLHPRWSPATFVFIRRDTRGTGGNSCGNRQSPRRRHSSAAVSAERNSTEHWRRIAGGFQRIYRIISVNTAQTNYLTYAIIIVSNNWCTIVCLSVTAWTDDHTRFCIILL